MKEKKGFVSEFKEFITRGNVMDMAIGIIMGTAFTAIVTSLVDDIIMPVIGIVIGGIDFSALSVNVGDATLPYGKFIMAVINFLLISFVIFWMVKSVNMVRKPAEEEVEQEEPAADIVLLEEIRDLLKDKK